MAEYIEREAAISVACKGCNKEFPNEPCEPADCHIQQGLFAIPAADVVEVRHGVWKFRKSWDFFVCSKCSFEHTNYSHYCPNCGADMRGGKGG